MSAAQKRAWLLAGALCGAVLVLDQAIKAVVGGGLVPGAQGDQRGARGRTRAPNPGVASGRGGGSVLPLIAFAVLALAFVGFLLARNSTVPGIWVAVGLVAGGALGNLADRLRAGEVTDFIEVGSWPPFNLADVAITVGVAVFALIFLREDGR